MPDWITLEREPRRLIVKGRSGIDPDCLVAHLEGDSRPLWVVDGGSKIDRCLVCGLEGNVYASQLGAKDAG